MLRNPPTSCSFGDLEGGELVVEEPNGDRVLSEKNAWHKFCGREHCHYNLPHTGTKFSIVAYSQNGKPSGKSKSIVESSV